MANLTTSSSKQLNRVNRAAALKERITTLEEKLASLPGGAVSAGSDSKLAAVGRKFKMSAAGRKRIAAVQRARWAKVRDSKL